MLVCPNCNQQQEEGRFCGSCGTALEPVSQADSASVQEEAAHSAVSFEDYTSDPVSEPDPTPPQQEIPSQPNNSKQVATHTIPNEPITQQVNEEAATAEAPSTPTAEAIKGGLNNYWNYFLSLLKNTTKSFDLRDNNFSNGMISILLYAVLFTLSMYFLSSTTYNSTVGVWTDSSVPFLAFFVSLLITFIILILVSLGCMFAMMKLGKARDSFKMLITQFGAAIVPFVAINVIATLSGLLGLFQFTVIMWTLSFFGVFIFMPVLFIYEKLSHATKNGLRIHLSLGYVILLTVVTLVFLNALLQDIIDSIPTQIMF